MPEHPIDSNNKDNPVHGNANLDFTYSDDASPQSSPRLRMEMCDSRTYFDDESIEEEQILGDEDEIKLSSSTCPLISVGASPFMNSDDFADNLLETDFSESVLPVVASVNITPQAIMPQSRKHDLFVQTNEDILEKVSSDRSPKPIGVPPPLRRVYSSPDSTLAYSLSPTIIVAPNRHARIPRAEMNNIPRAGVNGISRKNDPLAATYSLSRQMSLPVTSQERTPSITRKKIRKFTVSPDFTLDKDKFQKKMALSAYQGSPSTRNSTQGSHFRTVVTPAHRLRRGSNSTLHDQSLPESRSGTPRSQRVDTKVGELEYNHVMDRTDNAYSPPPLSTRRLSLDDSWISPDIAASARHQRGLQFWLRNDSHYMAYVSAFAIFGSTFRVFIGRFFGLDCENPNGISDFWMSLSKGICVTTSGETSQTGGALFTDLPANMIGSFIMGVVSNIRPDLWPPLPWFHKDHPLQQYEPLHVGIKTGFCGSLTTFSSWNTQMVIMMDGTHTELGTQVVAAIVGYILGLVASIGCYVFGTQVSIWINRHRYPNIDPQMDSASDDDSVGLLVEEGGLSSHVIERTYGDGVIVCPDCRLCRPLCRVLTFTFSAKYIAFTFLAGIFVAMIVADAIHSIPFYRTMWLSVLLTPPGAILRWQISKWNGRWSLMGRFTWLPWGTFLCNISASIVSVLCVAIQFRFYGDVNSSWPVAILGAIRTGFAGSLSTVSTFVKEFIDLNNIHQHHGKAYNYALITILTSALLCLTIYSSIVRF